MTKKTLFLGILVFTNVMFSSVSYAQKTLAECEKIEASTDKQFRCLDSVKELLEREMQTWVNNHIFNLEEKAQETGRRSALKMFKRAQDDFITFRDNDCRWQYLAISPEKGADFAYKKCYIVVTQSRINQLSIIP